MDTEPYRCACRVVCYTLAMAATLIAPAALQAALLLRPELIADQYAGAALSCALAATIVAFPALVRALLTRDHRGLPP